MNWFGKFCSQYEFCFDHGLGPSYLVVLAVCLAEIIPTVQVQHLGSTLGRVVMTCCKTCFKDIIVLLIYAPTCILSIQ
jgi:hypothetical protein